MATSIIWTWKHIIRSSVNKWITAQVPAITKNFGRKKSLICHLKTTEAVFPQPNWEQLIPKVSATHSTF